MAPPDPATSERVARDLCAFVTASPTPFHAAATAASRLVAAGFEEVTDAAPWAFGAGGWFVRRGGSIVAWHVPEGPSARFRIVGAHTDSPNLRVKPRPDHVGAGVAQVGVEVYGGALLNSWLDRDLGVAGRVVVRDGAAGGSRTVLFRVDEPILRIPQLAIHLDRDVNERGLVLNKQAHMAPMWGAAGPGAPAFRSWLAGVVGVEAGDIVGYDAMLHDTAPPTLLGPAREYVSSARLDNLLSCHAAVEALIAAATTPGSGGGSREHVAVIALFDHEEVGSTSAQGADGALLATVLERIGLALGFDRGTHLAALAASHCVSADGAHATHPNYPERHEPDHRIALNGGPVVKTNTSMRYATDAETAAPFLDACREVGVDVQWFVTRSDLACGSTIGPLTAARLGVATVDVGVAQLAMHSARELCGAHDPARFVAALGAYLSGTGARPAR